MGKFRIDKIERKKNLHIITAYRNDSIFTIVSNKNTNCQNNTNMISRKIDCILNLQRLHPRNNFISYAEISYYIHQGVKIKLDEKNHWSIYFATNLDGLCIRD